MASGTWQPFCLSPNVLRQGPVYPTEFLVNITTAEHRMILGDKAVATMVLT